MVNTSCVYTKSINSKSSSFIHAMVPETQQLYKWPNTCIKNTHKAQLRTDSKRRIVIPLTPTSQPSHLRLQPKPTNWRMKETERYFRFPRRLQEYTDGWLSPRAIALMKEAAKSSEISVNFYQIIRHNNSKNNNVLRQPNLVWCGSQGKARCGGRWKGPTGKPCLSLRRHSTKN